MNSATNQFLKKTTVFLALPLIIFAGTVMILNLLNNKIFNEFKIDKNITTVFIGDSHIQQAVNDKIVNNSINLSQNSESYYFSFNKIDGLIKNNTSIKKIYLGFSYHSLSSYNEDFVFGKFSKDISARYFFILPLSEKLKFIRYNSKDILAYFKNILINGVHNVVVKNNQCSFLGSYENNFKNTTVNRSSMDKRLLFQFYSHGKLDPFSTYNIFYLNKIISLCKTNKIELVLLNTPLQNYYEEKIPVEYKAKYREIIENSGLQMLNLNGLPLNDSCFIPDGDHVSQKGALLLSNYLADTKRAQ